jgi:hypothetical protein
MSRTGWRPHIEDALTLDLGVLLRSAAIRPGEYTSGTLTFSRTFSRQSWAVCEAVYVASLSEHGGRVTLSHPYEYDLALDTMRMPYGGLSWYWRCPITGKRARKLFLFDGMEKFCCLDAISRPPTYELQRGSKLSRAVERKHLAAARLDAARGTPRFNKALDRRVKKTLLVNALVFGA